MWVIMCMAFVGTDDSVVAMLLTALCNKKFLGLWPFAQPVLCMSSPRTQNRAIALDCSVITAVSAVQSEPKEPDNWTM